MISLSEYINESIINEDFIDKIKKTFKKVDSEDPKKLSVDDFFKQLNNYIKEKFDNVKIKDNNDKFVYTISGVEIRKVEIDKEEHFTINLYGKPFEQKFSHGSTDRASIKLNDDNDFRDECNTVNLDKLKLMFQGITKAKNFIQKAFDKIKNNLKSDSSDSGSGGFDSTSAAAGAIYRMTMDN